MRPSLEQTAEQAIDMNIALAARAGFNVEFKIGIIVRQFRGCAPARPRPAERGPRFVCRMTPVALMTGRSEWLSACRSCSSTAPPSPSRASRSAGRIQQAGGNLFAQAREHGAGGIGDRERFRGSTRAQPTPGVRSTSSTDGSSRNSSDLAVLFISARFSAGIIPRIIP